MSDRVEAEHRPHVPLPAEQLLALTEGGESGAAPVPPPTLGYAREPVATQPAAEIPAPLVRRSLTGSVLDACAWSIMDGAGARNVGNFVAMASENPMAVAVIGAFPGLLGAGAQWLGAEITDVYRRRRRMFVGSAIVQACTWIPMAWAMFLLPGPRYWVMVAAWTLYVIMGNFGIPAWQSVMGDLVPANWRGRYFALRQLAYGSVLITGSLLAGRWLDHSESAGLDWLGLHGRAVGFFSVFVLAGLSRCVSTYFLTWMYDPPYQPQPSDHFTFWQFLRRAPSAQYGRFVIYQSMFVLGTNFAGMFFGWYMLRPEGLHFTLYAVAVLGAVNMVTIFAIQPLWGVLIDRIGTKRVMTFGGFGIALVPALFLLSSNFGYWVAVNIYDGVVWSAWGLACGMYMFDIVTPAKRARCTAFSSILVTSIGMLGTFAGAASASIIPHIWPLPWTAFGFVIKHPFGVLLIISAVLRFWPNLVLLPTFREARVFTKPPTSALAPAE